MTDLETDESQETIQLLLQSASKQGLMVATIYFYKERRDLNKFFELRNPRYKPNQIIATVNLSGDQSYIDCNKNRGMMHDPVTGEKVEYTREPTIYERRKLKQIADELGFRFLSDIQPTYYRTRFQQKRLPSQL